MLILTVFLQSISRYGFEDVANIEEYFAQFGDLLPQEMADELAKLKANLSK